MRVNDLIRWGETTTQMKRFILEKRKKKTQTQDYNNSLPEQEFDEWNRALSFLVHGSSGNTRMKRDVVEDERIR